MKYRAFISYRRQDASAAARWLREKLLGFRPPKALLEEITPERRVAFERPVAYFLDTSYQSANEDFWKNNIEPALRDSEYLIVVSSPSALLKRADGEDNWVAREIAAFLEIHGDEEGRRRIIVVLSSGAPVDRFPGRLSEFGDYWDWADLRDVSRFAALRAGVAERLGDALLKVVARLYDVPQHLLPILTREEARRRGRLRIAVGAMAAIVFVVLSGALGWAVVERGNALQQRDQARRTQMQLLAQLSSSTLERGDWGTALALALEALPRDGADRNRPYVVEAERALREALMAPIPETHVLRAGGREKLLDILEGGIAVMQDFKTRPGPAGSGTVEVEPVVLHVLDAPRGRTLAVLRGHTGFVHDLAISGDGRLLLSGAADGTARLWDIASQSQRAVFPGHSPDSLIKVALSRDGALVATASQDGSVRLWRVARDGAVGEPRLITNCPVALVYAPTIRFSPDDRALAIGCRSDVRLFSLERDHEIALERPMFAKDGWEAPPELAFLAGRLYATSLDFKQPRIGLLTWDVETGHYVDNVATSGIVGNLQGSNDGTHLLATAYDTALLWTVNAGAPLELRHPLPIVQARMLADGRRVVTLTHDGVMRLWDASGRVIASWRGFQGAVVNRLALSRDERSVVVSGRLEDSMQVWELANRDVRSLRVPLAVRPPDPWLPNPASPALTALAVSADGSRIAAGFLDGYAYVWRASDAQLIATIDAGQSRTMMSLQFSPTDASLLMSSAEESDARLWNADSGELVARLLNSAGQTHAGKIVFSGDGKWIAGADIFEVILWDGRTGAYVKTRAMVRSHTPDPIKLLSFSPDSRFLLASGPAIRNRGPLARVTQDTATGQIWQGPDWNESDPIDYGEEWRTADFTADGAEILVALHDQVRLLGRRGGGNGKLIGEHPFVNRAMFAPDGRTVVSGFFGELRVWPADGTGRFIEFETGAASWGHQLVFSADSTRLLLASSDRKAQLWQIAGRALLATLPLDEVVTHMRFTADGIVTGSGDRTLRLWRYPRTTQALLADACARMTRPLSREQRRQFLLDENPKDPPCGWHSDMKEKPRH